MTRLWCWETIFRRNHLGSDQNVIGQTIQLDGVSHTVIGVMAEDFRTFLPYFDSPLRPVGRQSVATTKANDDGLL